MTKRLIVPINLSGLELVFYTFPYYFEEIWNGRREG